MTQGRNETVEERADRNWQDLMQELRVSQTGTQLLAGFLMTLPFQEGFEDIDRFQRGWYLGLVALALLTVGLTLTPVAMHRHHFRAGVKEQVVTVAHRLTSIALACVALLMAGILSFIFAVVLGNVAGLIAGGVGLAVLVGLLVVTPRFAVPQ